VCPSNQSENLILLYVLRFYRYFVAHVADTKSKHYLNATWLLGNNN